MPVFVDAHVHFHPSFQGDSFLDAAWRNLTRAAERRGARTLTGVLLLADPPGRDSLTVLRDGASRRDSRWSVEQLDEEIALRASGPDGAVLTLVQGYQIPTAERLEVLALCCREAFAAGGTDGRPGQQVAERWRRDRGALGIR
jgi:hypothetical protein